MSDLLVVLVVDDEAVIADVVDAALREAGFEVVVASTAEEAVSVLDKQSRSIRGLVTDVNLGKGMNGFELGHRARELLPELPVLYMTGASAHEWSSQGVPNSVVIPKPFVAAQIVTALSSLLNITGI